MRSLMALILLSAVFHSQPTEAYCFNIAGEKNRIDPLLLKSIAIQESNLNQHAINLSGNKLKRSKDYGLMQINSLHIPQLKKKGIIKTERDLLNKPCLNVQIAAEILSQHLHICGRNWECLGSYNAGFARSQKRTREIYAKKIRKIYTTLHHERKSRKNENAHYLANVKMVR